MNKTQLIQSVMSRTGMDEKSAREAVCAVFDTVADTLASGEKVQIAGFGSFHVKERAAHAARNPMTGEAVQVPATRTLSFTLGKTMKEKL